MVPVQGEPAARWGDWATGSGVDARFGQVLTGHTDWVVAVATAVVDGRPVAVTGSWDRTVRVWDLWRASIGWSESAVGFGGCRGPGVAPPSVMVCGRCPGFR